MAYETFNLEDGRIQVRCASHGPLVHIIQNGDGSFEIEEEGGKGEIFKDYRSVLLAARKLGQDPDL